ncbi:MAG: hypothetical protein WCI72_06205 [archaeon]
MSILDDLYIDGKLSGKPIKIDIKAERRRRIKEVGDYNAELLSRQKNPEELVFPIFFKVQMRMDDVIYDFSGQGGETPLDKLEGVSFYRPLDVRNGDQIQAYFLWGKFENMKEEGGLAYITGKDPIRTCGFEQGDYFLPSVLVWRLPEKLESALAIDLRQNDEVISRDLDWELIDKYGPSLRKYFEEKNSELIEQARGRNN